MLITSSECNNQFHRIQTIHQLHRSSARLVSAGGLESAKGSPIWYPVCLLGYEQIGCSTKADTKSNHAIQHNSRYLTLQPCFVYCLICCFSQKRVPGWGLPIIWPNTAIIPKFLHTEGIKCDARWNSGCFGTILCVLVVC